MRWEKRGLIFKTDNHFPWMSHHASNPIADKIRVLYGGSVKAENAGDLLAGAEVDGGLVGGASLLAEELVAIVRAAVAPAVSRG